jgi:hypothetical protein
LNPPKLKQIKVQIARILMLIVFVQINGCALVQTDLKFTLDGWSQARIGAEGIKNYFLRNAYSVDVLTDMPLTLIVRHTQFDCKIQLEFDEQQRLRGYQFLSGVSKNCPNNNTSWRLQ